MNQEICEICENVMYHSLKYLLYLYTESHPCPPYIYKHQQYITYHLPYTTWSTGWWESMGTGFHKNNIMNSLARLKLMTKYTWHTHICRHSKARTISNESRIEFPTKTNKLISFFLKCIWVCKDFRRSSEVNIELQSSIQVCYLCIKCIMNVFQCMDN